MCGIVGYIGEKEKRDFLINGLKELEYRGYDSAGIAILKNGEIIEQGLTNNILFSPKEDYTKRLINSTFKDKTFRT